MAEKVKVSVIVPVYNVEQYLAECLDSLVSQTLEDIEILVVNDGSPDNSQAIIDDYAARYPDKKLPHRFNFILEEFGNLTSTAIVKVPRGCCFNQSVEYVSATEDPTATPTPIITVQNSNLVIDRIA